MKTCPNCSAEIEDNFEICWNCNYSYTEKKEIDFKDLIPGSKEIDCLRCQIPLIFSGNFKFHEGGRLGVTGSFFSLFLNRESFDLYVCPKCGKVEFFVPQKLA